MGHRGAFGEAADEEQRVRVQFPGTTGRLPWLAGAGAGLLAYTFGYQSRAWTNDADAALQPAWSLIHRGTLRVPDGALTPGEFVSTPHGMYSNRPLGMILASIPGQLFSPREPSELGSAVTAAVLCAFIAFLVTRMFGRLGLVGVFGAPLLYVAGRTLWPQTVGLLTLLVALALARRSRTSRAAVVGVGIVVMATTLCRVPLGLLLIPVVAAWADDENMRHWWRSRTLIAAAGGVVAGLVVLVAYAQWQFGSWSPTPGYPVSHTLDWAQIPVGLFSPARGLLFWSPFVLTVRPNRRGAVVLTWAAAYTVVSWLLYNAWGGDGYTGYRYSLALAFLAVPFVRFDTVWRRACVAWSLGLGVTATTLTERPIARSRVWTQTGMPALVLAYAVLLSIVCFAGWEYLRWRQGHAASRHRPLAAPTPATATV